MKIANVLDGDNLCALIQELEKLDVDPVDLLVEGMCGFATEVNFSPAEFIRDYLEGLNAEEAVLATRSGRHFLDLLFASLSNLSWKDESKPSPWNALAIILAKKVCTDEFHADEFVNVMNWYLETLERFWGEDCELAVEKSKDPRLEETVIYLKTLTVSAGEYLDEKNKIEKNFFELSTRIWDHVFFLSHLLLHGMKDPAKKMKPVALN